MVLAAATSTFFINTLHFFLTGRARKAAKIAYPRSYASEEEAAKDPKAYAFNCGMLLREGSETARESTKDLADK